jgi:hypothetical protein
VQPAALAVSGECATGMCDCLLRTGSRAAPTKKSIIRNYFEKTSNVNCGLHQNFQMTNTRTTQSIFLISINFMKKIPRETWDIY